MPPGSGSEPRPEAPAVGTGGDAAATHGRVQSTRSCAAIPMPAAGPEHLCVMPAASYGHWACSMNHRSASRLCSVRGATWLPGG